jgi:hypothetical protein
MPVASSNLPRVMRPRPTDATGWFWAVVCLVVGVPFLLIHPPFAVILVVCPFCFLWQFKKWHTNSSIVKTAVAWCGRHFPNAGGTPIVDFAVALAHDAHIDLRQCSPTTLLADLNWMSDDDWAVSQYPESQHRTQAWLEDLFSDARIKGFDVSGFSGTTLGDAIEFLTLPRTAG